LLPLAEESFEPEETLFAVAVFDATGAGRLPAHSFSTLLVELNPLQVNAFRLLGL